ncbi:MAG: protein serine/threonine phosphatase [Actinomycetia bacterium]|nr:protein serine/threonine phosphatase [Actinomycetes bacterium]
MVVCSTVGSGKGVRDNAGDAGYAGARLLVVAGGEGAGGGAVADAMIETFRTCGIGVASGEDVGTGLDAAITAVRARLQHLKEGSPVLSDTYASFAAMAWSGRDIAVANLGDAAAFLLRDGELFQITEDNLFHGCVINPWWHPTSLRTLDDKREVDIEVLRRTAQMCDCYLLCTGGLLTAVPAETMWEVLTSVQDRAWAVQRLLDLAKQRGGPSSITCMIADVIPGPQRP